MRDILHFSLLLAGYTHTSCTLLTLVCQYSYGFYDECNRKYGNASVWRHCVQCFDTFGIGAIIDGSVLCVHGGLSPDVRTIDQIRAIDRQQEIPVSSSCLLLGKYDLQMH